MWIENYTIHYTSNKHGYVTVKDGQLLLKIPHRLRGNDQFRDLLLAKGENLLMRKKDIWQRREWNSVWVFGEQVSISELCDDEWDDALEQSLTQILREYCEPLIDEYAARLWYDRGRLRIRRLRSKWGSCSSWQNISLNLDLVHLPTRLIRYVVIHEVCHLQHKHHQSSFWDEVERFCPDYKLLRRELKCVRFE